MIIFLRCPTYYVPIQCVPIYLNTQTASSLMVQIFKLYVPLAIDYTLIPIGVYISRHLERCIYYVTVNKFGHCWPVLSSPQR